MSIGMARDSLQARPFFRFLAAILALLGTVALGMGVYSLVRGNWTHGVRGVVIGVSFLGLFRVAITGRASRMPFTPRMLGLRTLSNEPGAEDPQSRSSAATGGRRLAALSPLCAGDCHNQGETGDVTRQASTGTSGRPVDPAELTHFERLVSENILQALGPFLHKSVDPSRTTFRVYDADHARYPKRIICHIRRTTAALLDVDVVFGENGPRLDAGPPPTIIPLGGELGYRIWEPDFSKNPDWEAFAAEVRPFLQDWLEGLLTLETTYAGNKAYRWILKRGNEVLGERRLVVFPYLAPRRKVVEHT